MFVSVSFLIIGVGTFHQVGGCEEGGGGGTNYSL